MKIKIQKTKSKAIELSIDKSILLCNILKLDDLKKEKEDYKDMGLQA